MNLLRNTSEDKEVRAKAQYALSGLIKHCPDALKQFQEKGGFDVLAEIVKNPDGKLLVIFLYVICRECHSQSNQLKQLEQ